MSSVPHAAAANDNVAGADMGQTQTNSPIPLLPLIDDEEKKQDEANVTKIPFILPHERVFPIQIGSELFKLSGASISSDAPSYFSQYFLCQVKQAEEAGEDPCSEIRTLYIDRDPLTFRDIALHLQGYHIAPRDSTHFVRLFADAQFYSLPRLVSQLYNESIFISVGHREFQIPRSLLTDPGNSPNFFSLGFAVLFSSPDNLFPGIDRHDLMRPPSILPPSVPSRSADNFEELLYLLRGYPLCIRDDEHRQALLQDCRYFHFKGLEQRLIPHRIAYNQARRRDEITLRIEDIMKSGVTVLADAPVTPSGTGGTDRVVTTPPSPPLGGTPMPHTQNYNQNQNRNQNNNYNHNQHQQGLATPPPVSAWVYYARPFLDTPPAELILEISGESTRLHFTLASAASVSPSLAGAAINNVRAEFFGEKRKRVVRLLEVIASKLSLSTTKQPLGLLMSSGGAGSQPESPRNTALCDEDRVRVAIVPESSVLLDGKPWLPFVAWRGADDMAAAASRNGDPTMPVRVTHAVGESHHVSVKRRRVDGHGAVGTGVAAVVTPGDEWLVKNGLWRLMIQRSQRSQGSACESSGVECVMVAVKINALSSEHARNSSRDFLND